MSAGDLTWGSLYDIRGFHPPAGKFEGVIGGPPCQSFSPIGNVNMARYGEGCVMPDLIPEFARVVREAEPTWWVMENSQYAYAPLEPCFKLHLDTAWLGLEQNRRRVFWSSHRLPVEVPALVGVDAGTQRTVCSMVVDNGGSRAREPKRTLEQMLELQGIPKDVFDHSPLTVQGKRKLCGNAVPLPMAIALARAVRKAVSP